MGSSSQHILVPKLCYHKLQMIASFPHAMIYVCDWYCINEIPNKASLIPNESNLVFDINN